MIFTSYTYVLFLFAVFVLHWLVPSAWRKPLLVIASYVFYASWLWQYSALLLAVSLFNWAYGGWVLPAAKSNKPLVAGILVNLVPLIYYKYSMFFIANAAAAANVVGADWNPGLRNIIIPLGISFFTFQGIAYLFDIATGEKPLRNVVDFLLFKALWPQLIAGPIIRIQEIRSQIEGQRTLDYANVAAGADRIVRGMFKKVVLADTLAPIVDTVFITQGQPHALDTLFGTLAFGLQIYFDFSAYSDIAIGSALLFGFRFPENFNWPYVASSPQEFWNRWHMTLSRWIRDYLYTPLSFAVRDRPTLAPLWLLVAMAICGLWHGAQWTFVIWGLWHGVLLVAGHTVLKRYFARAAEPSARTSFLGLSAWALTFTGVMVGWLIFRAPTLGQAWSMLHSVITLTGGVTPGILRVNNMLIVSCMFAGLILLQTMRPPAVRLVALQPAARWLRFGRPLAYSLLILLIIILDQEAKAFVYFQF
jgi:alginate O-acetyltransferase complex protein AlgI